MEQRADACHARTARRRTSAFALALLQVTPTQLAPQRREEGLPGEADESQRRRRAADDEALLLAERMSGAAN